MTSLRTLLLAGVVGLLLAVGSPLGALLYFGAPGWSATGSPGRAAVLLVLALCVTAGSVNLDEELTSLSSYQQAYSASAQVISAINSMMQTVINMKTS